MSLFRLTLRTQGVCRNASKNFFSSTSTKSRLQPSSSSSLITERNNKNSSRRFPTFPQKNDPNSSLYRRISPVGDPDVSIVPVLDQWVKEGRKVDKDALDSIIKSLKKYKRFKHALEISMWMTDKRYIPPTKADITSRLHLIYKVHGLKKAEEFYNNISQIFKGHEVDITLLNIYSHEKSVDKAEAMMQKLRESGCLITSMPFNILLNLYYIVGNWDKMDALTNEMEEKGIYGNKYSYTPRLCAYAATCNIERLNKTMEIMEADPRVGINCDTYVIAANAFFKAGLVEKSLELLKKVEEMVITTKDKYKIINTVLIMYAKFGKKDEMYRMWEILKKGKIYNTGYRNMIRSLLKFDDIEEAERVFKEWETTDLSYDFGIPDQLIDFYVKKGEFEKAEKLFKCGLEKGGSPTFHTWYCIMIGFLEDNQVLKGVEALKNATLSCRFLPFEKPVKDKLTIVLEYLERRRNVEELEGFMKSLEADGIFSSSVCGKLLDYITNEASES